MAGSSSGIQIYAVFISKFSGEVLKKFSGRTDVEVWIIPIDIRELALIEHGDFIHITARHVCCFSYLFLCEKTSNKSGPA